MHRRIPSLGWLLFAVIVLTLCLLSGCRSADRSASAGSERASHELGERLLAAFTLLVPESCRASTPETAFREATGKLTEQFGEITGWRFLGEAETPGFRQLLWLVGFERPRRHPSSEKPNETVRRELLFRLLTGESADGTKIAGFGFL